MWLSALFFIPCIVFSSIVEDGFCCSHFLFCSICTSRLKLKPQQVTVVSDSIITVKPGKSKSTLNYQLQNLKETVPKVVIKVSVLMYGSSLLCCFSVCFMLLSTDYILRMSSLNLKLLVQTSEIYHVVSDTLRKWVSNC